MEVLDLQLEEVRLRALAHGPADGPVILCAHGLSANAMAFEAVADALVESGARVVALDLRGRGRSDVPPPGSYGLRRHAGDVLAAADILRAERFHFIGWSMGALIGMLVAEQAPERMVGLTLIDHAGRMDDSAVDAVRTGLQRLEAVVPSEQDYLDAVRRRVPVRRWDGHWEAFYRYELARREDGSWSPTTSARACLEDLAEADGHDWKAIWRRLEVPVLLLRCTEPLNGGFIVPAAEARAFADTVAGARTVEVPVNHFDVITDATAIAAIADFVRSPARPAA